VLLLVVAVLGVSYASSLRAWLQQRSDVNTLTAQIATSRAQIAALQQAKQRLHDPAYLRTQARERFGWLMPGEIGYRVIDAHGKIVQTGSQLSDPVAAPEKAPTEWWDRAWSSVVAAGSDPAGRSGSNGRSPGSPSSGFAPRSSVGPQVVGLHPHPPSMQMGPKRWLRPDTLRTPVGR
jgi:Septum formation initiator